MTWLIGSEPDLPLASTSVGETFLAVDGRPWHSDNGTAHVLEDNGRQVIEAYATDQAGNVSAVIAVQVQIERATEGK